MTLEQLLCLSNEEIEHLFKHKNVIIRTKDGEELNFFVQSLMLAANPPHLFVGFISEYNKRIGMEDIYYIEVKK